MPTIRTVLVGRVRGNQVTPVVWVVIKPNRRLWLFDNSLIHNVNFTTMIRRAIQQYKAMQMIFKCAFQSKAKRLFSSLPFAFLS